MEGKNLFDFIGKLLLGYKGYVFRDEKGNTDKKLRDEDYKKLRLLFGRCIYCKGKVSRFATTWPHCLKSLKCQL